MIDPAWEENNIVRGLVNQLALNSTTIGNM